MESQSIVVSESENVGNLVAMVQAEDPDSDTLWYSISGICFAFFLYNKIGACVFKHHLASFYELRKVSILSLLQT